MNDRKIQFRGKSIDDGKWVFGYLVMDETKENANIVHRQENNTMQNTAVDPNTVGQYIGIDDKNGVPIYDGDIVNMHQFLFDGAEVECETRGIVDWLAAEWGLINIQSDWLSEYTGYKNGDDEFAFPICNFYGMHEESFEVIGNIFDQPMTAPL